jgi:regulator of protease activity HflC (stomatin/prohibitin superfamily)
MDAPGQNPPPAPVEEIPGPGTPLVDPAQQSLVRALRSSFTVLRFIMIILVVLYLSSGVFQIQPGEQGVIARLGTLVENKDTGGYVFNKGWIWWALPDPFDEKIRISGNLQKLEIDTFMFHRNPNDIANHTDIATLRPTGDSLKPGVDGAMLTGDKNLSHGLWVVEYQIADAAQFVQNIGDRLGELEPLLRRLFESAIVQEVAHRRVEEVTRTKIDVIADQVRRRLQQELDTLHAGVDVVKVNPQTIVPAQVAPAFSEVVNAENERKQEEHAARQKATETLNQAAGPEHRALLAKIRAYGIRELAGADHAELLKLRSQIDDLLEDAQGEAAAKLHEGRAHATDVREKIRTEYTNFKNLLTLYRKFPQATLVDLWRQMREEVLDNKNNELFWVPDSNIIEVIVNRDPQRALEAERERLKMEAEAANR